MIEDGAVRRRSILLAAQERTKQLICYHYVPLLKVPRGQSLCGSLQEAATHVGAAGNGQVPRHRRDRGAHAIIPSRKNAKPWKPLTAGAVARNDALRASKYLGGAIWQKWIGYHRRSRAETKMRCVELLGQSLMARHFDRPVAELQVRAAVLNRYTALGIPVTEPMR